MKNKPILVALSAASLLGALALPSTVHAGSDGSSGDIIGIVGSDTTYFVMEKLAEAHNINTTYNPNADKAINIAPLLGASPSVNRVGGVAGAVNQWLVGARLAWPGGQVLPADDNCTTQYVFGGAGSQDNTTTADGDVIDILPPTTVASQTVADVAYTEVTSVPGGLPSNVSAGVTVRLGVVPPNGSGNGRSAISGTAINGVTYNSSGNAFACLDIARSSSYPSSADIGTKFESWAFALDAIGWNYFPGNTHTAVSVGLQQSDLDKIYKCFDGTGAPGTLNFDLNGDGTPDSYNANGDSDVDDVGDRKLGYPVFRFWGDITNNSSDTTPIKAYRIQPGSGTGDDVARTLIRGNSSASGADTTFLTGCDGYNSLNTDNNAGSSYTFPIVQEHDCRGVAALDKPDAICFYGYSRWVLQARSLETDKRNDAIFGKFGTTSANLTRPSFSSINTTANRYLGTRYVFNILPLNSGADVARTPDVRRFIGVTPGGTAGFICGDPIARRIIASFGLKPLPMGATDVTASAASYGQSYCRRNAAAVFS